MESQKGRRSSPTNNIPRDNCHRYWQNPSPAGLGFCKPLVLPIPRTSKKHMPPDLAKRIFSLSALVDVEVVVDDDAADALVSTPRPSITGPRRLSYYDDDARAGLLDAILLPNDLAPHDGYGPDDRLTAVDIGGRSRLVLDYDGRVRWTGWRHQASGASLPGN